MDNDNSKNKKTKIRSCPVLFAQKGATMIEAAMGLGLFFIIIFFSFDLFWIAYSKVAMQFVVTDLARRGAVSFPPAQACQEIKNTVVNNLRNPWQIIVEEREVTLTGENGAITCGNPARYLEQGSLFTISVVKNQPVLLNLLHVTIQSDATAAREF